MSLTPPMHHRGWSCGLALAVLLVASSRPVPAGSGAGPYDVVIVGGRVVSGRPGAEPVAADVGIVGDRIVAVGDLDPRGATLVLDAKGRLVTPGFIDLHTHADMNLEDNPQAANYLLQGVTTILAGNCGGSIHPLKKLFRRLRRRGLGVNFASLVGHLTVREWVMGQAHDPEGDDLARMKRLIRKDMKSGAMGFSTGLVYRPGLFASTEELIELTSVVADYGGLYASHIRGEGDGVREAVEEAIRIGETNGLRVQISHIKLASEAVRGHPELIVEPIVAAWDRGVEVLTDQYPYAASGTSLWAFVPWWAWGDGYESFVEYLESPGHRAELRDHYVETGFAAYSLDRLYIALSAAHPEAEGKTIRRILGDRGLEPTPENAADVIIELQRDGFVRIFYFVLRMRDVDTLAALPFNMIASDSSALRIDDPGIGHPRNFGTFPRAMQRFVKKKKLLTIGEAIHKMTAMPASVLRLPDRGMIEPGYKADVVVLDLRKIKDRSSYSRSAYPRGIAAVLVNGRVAALDGEVTGELSGRILKNPNRRLAQ